MREEWKIILKRLSIGVFFFILSIFPLKNILLSVKFADPNVDFIYVIFALFLPHLFRFIGLGFITYAMTFFWKITLLPRYIVEREMYSIARRRWRKGVFYSVLVLFFLIFPFRSGHYFIEILRNLQIYLPYYFFPAYSFLFLIAHMDIALFFWSIVPAGFLIHMLKIASLRRAKIVPKLKKRIFEEGREVEFEIEINAPFLVPIPRPFLGMKTEVKADIFKRKIKVKCRGDLPIGYYRFDILKFEIATFPFFFSTIFRIADEPIEITVLPKVKIKNVLYSRNPYLIRETGELIKKVSGSSMEFAGIREFHIGDSLSRVWWKGLAKGGKMLTKDFYSPAEDRWILVLDLSDPEMREEEEEVVLTFARSFVETYTRKDVEISLHLISPEYSYLNYSRNKRELLSFIVKHWFEFRHISHKGARVILKDVIGNKVNEIEQRCKKSGISLASFLFYSGLIRKPRRLFYWNRKRAIENAAREMIKSIKKSGKIVVITYRMNKEMAEEIAKIATIKKCPIIFASTQKIPQYRTYIIPEKNPEKAVWGLMYV